MRKIMNKKGFSLVELMIVVVIMGILIAVAIPLYGAIQDNAKNNTCESNIDVIKQNAANYYAINDKVATKGDIAKMFDDNALPVCPWTDVQYDVDINSVTEKNADGTPKTYSVSADLPVGAAKVYHGSSDTAAQGCGNYTAYPAK